MLNYKDIYDKLDYLCTKKNIYSEINLNSKRELEILIRHVFGKSDGYSNYNDVSIIDMNDYMILKYDNRDERKDINYKTISLIEKMHPVLKLEILENSNDKVNYSEIICSTYEKNTFYLENKLRIKHYLSNSSDEFEVYEVYALFRSNDKKREYSDIRTKIYMEKDLTVAFENNGRMWLKGENSFSQRLDIISKTLDKVEENIFDRIDSVIFDDDIKIYDIRKR